MMGTVVFVPRPGLVVVPQGGVLSLEPGSAPSHPERVRLQQVLPQRVDAGAG